MKRSSLCSSIVGYKGINKPSNDLIWGPPSSSNMIQSSHGSNIWGAPTNNGAYCNKIDFYSGQALKSGNANNKVIKTPGALSTSSQTTYEDDHFSYDWGTGKGISRRNTKENISGDALTEG